MTRRYESSIIIHAPAERVWKILCDVERWHTWTPSITHIERLNGASFMIGARFKILQPRLRPAIWTLTELQAARHFIWEMSQLGVRVVAGHMIEPIPQGCKVTLWISFDGPLGTLIGWLGRDITRHYVELESSGLKRQSEARDDLVDIQE